MEFQGSSCSSVMAHNLEDTDLRRGPWTMEEDLVLMNYVTAHGEGRWNSLARCAGLRRTGKSCRLRWLNYLRPDVRRGNITPEEQLLILELHSRWGNRWSKIAQHLPGRTDNEIKNYWRTRVQKHAKQLKCDVNSKRFKDVMRHVWMPHLVERIQAAAVAVAAAEAPSGEVANAEAGTVGMNCERPAAEAKLSPEDSSAAGSSTMGSSAMARVGGGDDNSGGDVVQPSEIDGSWSEYSAYTDLGSSDFDQSMWEENLWSVEDLWLQQLF